MTSTRPIMRARAASAARTRRAALRGSQLAFVDAVLDEPAEETLQAPRGVLQGKLAGSRRTRPPSQRYQKKTVSNQKSTL